MIQRLKNGDQTVLSQLYRQHRTDFIVWMTSRYKCNEETARDIYQDTMLTITIKAQNGELDHIESSLKTYIYGVAKNKYREYIRLDSRYLQLEDKILEEFKNSEPLQSRQKEIDLVKRSLVKLGEPCKSILELYYFHGMSMEEIMEHLTYKNANTVKNMKYKCFMRLKEIFHRDRKNEENDW
jgi:RNA polymerase sigma-70 factor (ECF subfamily)